MQNVKVALSREIERALINSVCMIQGNLVFKTGDWLQYDVVPHSSCLTVQWLHNLDEVMYLYV